MALTIQPDLVVKQELEARGVGSAVGVFGSHHVQIGKGTPVRIDKIASAKVPYAGFTKATQIARGKAGIRQTTADTLKTLAAPGKLDAGKLLGLLKAQQTHLDRLTRLGQLTPEQQKDPDGLWMFTKDIEGLSNNDLAAIFQKFNSPEMDLLQTALMREGRTNDDAADARMAASRLFDLQALLLKEIGNRAALANLDDLRAANPQDRTLDDENLQLPQKLSTEYGGIGADANTTRPKDISVTNLAILAEVSSESATNREKQATAETAKLEARKLDNVQLKEMGDVMRAAELTINIDIGILANKTAVFTEPDKPLANIWHLNDQGIKSKGEGYLEKRDSVEKTLFPEFSRHEVRADERPVYGALNLTHGFQGGSPVYGNAVIVLKPEVAKRATYTLLDTFLSTAVKVTPERRANLFALLDGATGIPKELRDLLQNPDSQERKDLDKWLDKLEATPNLALHQSFLQREIPKSIYKIIERYDKQDPNHLNNAETHFLGLLIGVFGDTEATRKNTVTHDNLEALLPQLGDVMGNALARAALENRNGNAPKLIFHGPEYIEAQIQGPIVPSRDIAEIRVDLTLVPPEKHDEYIAKLKAFQQQTGVKVVWAADNEIKDETQKLQDKQFEFNAQHLDMGLVDAMRDEILAAPVESAIKNLAKNDGYLTALPNGVKLTLTGRALDKAVQDFKATLARHLANPYEFGAKKLVESSLRDTIELALEKRYKPLKELGKLDFQTEAQRTAFAARICEMPEDMTVEELRLIHKHAAAHANALREIASAQPPLTAAQTLARLAQVAKAAEADFTAPINKRGDTILGKNSIAVEMEHISAMSQVLLQNAEPPIDEAQATAMLDRLDAPEMRAMSGQLDAIADWGSTAKTAGNTAVAALHTLLKADTAALAAAVGRDRTAPRTFAGDLTLVQDSMRNTLRTLSPAFADAFEAKFPGHPKFPAPANAAKMPQNAAQRRQFLVNVLEPYRQKELKYPERGLSVHGRGHIIRASFFANAMCNILKEQGVFVDKNAVLCGIAGHDIGRAGLGEDDWEDESSKGTITAMKENFGPDAMGEDYEKEIGGIIRKTKVQWQGKTITTPESKTLEGQLLNAADCLDIGRTRTFSDFYFDFLRGPNAELTPDAKKLRDGLVKEADLLQRLTNPLCRNRAKLDEIETELIPARGERSTQLSALNEELKEGINNTFILDAEKISNEDYLAKYEKIVKDNPQLFPLLSKYAFDN